MHVKIRAFKLATLNELQLRPRRDNYLENIEDQTGPTPTCQNGFLRYSKKASLLPNVRSSWDPKGSLPGASKEGTKLGWATQTYKYCLGI